MLKGLIYDIPFFTGLKNKLFGDWGGAYGYGDLKTNMYT
jgi:hypothetical protein